MNQVVAGAEGDAAANIRGTCGRKFLAEMERAALPEALFQVVQRGLISRSQIREAKVQEASRLQLEALLAGGKR